jgi:hypothetical protein
MVPPSLVKRKEIYFHIINCKAAAAAAAYEMVAPWRLCRACCCRYGIFPILVIPIVSLGCVLSVYSSTGCQFVDMEVGFQPVNEGWEATAPYSFGALFYRNASVPHDSMYRETLHSGCHAYSDEMYNNFIAGDVTFKMIQIMAMISIGSSSLAMVSQLMHQRGN